MVTIRPEPSGHAGPRSRIAALLTPALVISGAIASNAAWYSPVITGPLEPAVIPSNVSWPTGPLVVGPIYPTAIPSNVDWPSPNVIGPSYVDPAEIPSSQAWFDPIVAGPIEPTVLGPNQNWYNPTVAGPLSPDAIPSLQAWPSPTVTVEQVISPTTIASLQSWFAPYVANVLTVIPTQIPTHASWPNPKLVGNTQYIIPIKGIPSNAMWPQDLVVTGGALTGIQIFLAGVDITAYYLEITSNAPSVEPVLGGGGVPQSCVIKSQTIGRWQATFKLFDSTGTLAPALAQTVKILDYGVLIFAGCLQSVVINRELGTSGAITFECTATDKSGICDHRVIKGTPTYPIGSDVAQVFLDIVSNYLNGEGITTNHVPTNGSLGTLDVAETFNFNTVTQAFDQICTDAGLLWFIDVNGDLHICTEETFPSAPFALTETSRNWRGLTVSLNLLNYRNVQYAVSNLSVLPGSTSGGSSGGGGGSSTAVVTETFTWTVGSKGIQSIYYGGSWIPQLINVSLPIDSVQSIAVDGENQTVYELSNFSGETPVDGGDYVWDYLSANDPNGLNTVADYQVAPTFSSPELGATVVVNYIPATPSAAASVGEALTATPAPGAPTTGSLGTCGSGIYEAVEQVQNVSSLDGLNAIAQAVLDRYGSVPTTICFQTDFPGLRPGQLITIDIPLTYVTTAQFLITQVQGTHQGGDIGAGMSDGSVSGSFRWDIEVSSILDPGNWVKYFEELIERTQNALPVYQFEEADFALALSGGNIGNGLIATNPYIVKRTGLLFDMHAAASTPPVNQNLVLSFRVNNIPIPGQVIIGGGSTPNTDTVTTFPLQSPLYVFARPPNGPNDVITIFGSYRVTGPNPVNAVGVTAFLRWRI